MRMTMVRLLMTVVAGLGPATTALAQDEDTWRERAASPAATCYNGGGAIDGSLYVFGGYDPVNGVLLTTTWRYDPATNAWSSLATFPREMYDMGSAVAGGRLYSIGGADLFGSILSDVLVYDPGSNTWASAGADLPAGRTGAACASIDGIIYVCGGGDYYSNLSTVISLDPGTGIWSTRQSMAETRYRPFLGAVQGRLVVAGGSSSTGTHRSTAEYDPSANAWTPRADMPDGAPYGIYMGASASLGSRLFCVGGDRVIYDNRALFEYHAASNRWWTRARLPSGVDAGVAGVVNGKVYAIGTFLGGTSEIKEYTPVSLGTAPEAPTDLVQSVGGNPIPAGAWTGASPVTFEATLVDAELPDEKVRLEVEVRRVGESFTGVPNVLGGFVNSGSVKATFTGFAAGDYKWRARGGDFSGNAGPWTAFSATEPHFHSDQQAPSVPVIVGPYEGADVDVTNGGGGPVNFEWTPATDNGPSVGYEIQVLRDGEVIVGAASGEPSATIDLRPDRFNYQARVRSVDFAGNQSAWSSLRTFRVTFDDGKSAAAGDAAKVCGFSASAGASFPAILLAMALLLLRLIRS